MTTARSYTLKESLLSPPGTGIRLFYRDLRTGAPLAWVVLFVIVLGVSVMFI